MTVARRAGTTSGLTLVFAATSGADTAYVLVPGREDAELVTLRCLKHRHGERVDIALHFERRLQRFAPVDPTPTDRQRGETLAKLGGLWNRTPAAGEDDCE